MLFLVIQADQGLSRDWVTGGVASFCTSSLQRRRCYAQNKNMSQNKEGPDMSLISSFSSPFSFPLSYLSPLSTFPSFTHPFPPSWNLRVKSTPNDSLKIPDSGTHLSSHPLSTLWASGLLSSLTSNSSHSYPHQSFHIPRGSQLQSWKAIKTKQLTLNWVQQKTLL